MDKITIDTNKPDCPCCGSNKVKHDGKTIKGYQRMMCYTCGNYWQKSYLRGRHVSERKKNAIEEKIKFLEVALDRLKHMHDSAI